MKMLWNRETGESRAYEHVDAREILKVSPDLYTDKDPKGVAIEAAPQNADALNAVHRGRGSYSVMRGDTEVLPGLNKEEADAFNEKSAAEKSEFVHERKYGV